MLLSMLRLSFHSLDKEFEDTLGLGVDGVPEAIRQSKDRISGASDAWRVGCAEAMNSGSSL